ncbi:unnamed protein product [Arabidopsis thaliana]|uniref:(thale cress) hypothetical protein n=1 Tax=Arabidopsis thaliana TaxID=3702 RepID=A0A7G2EUT7_ARATH|nr:unnamed protein product [Arabidopsis thaliana]
MKSRVILNHRDRRDKNHNNNNTNHYTQVDTMERKPLEVEPSTTTTNTDVVDSFEEEQRKIVYRGWKVMPFIIGNETFEKLGIIGTLSNLLVYLTSVFNLKSYTAATIINAFSGTINFGTFIAAFLCDTYFGRYKTLSVAVIACFLGSFVILLTAAIPSLHPVACGNKISCEGPSVGQILFLLMGLGFLVVGAGGIRPCNLAFGADQFNPKSESGKKGINSFFNWYFFTFTFAQIISLTAVVYIQSNVSWTIGLIIPVALMFLACVIFFAGDRLYVKVKASGSPLAGIARVIAAAIKKRGLKPVKQPWVNLYNHIPSNYANTTLKYTDQFRIPAATYVVFLMTGMTVFIIFYDRVLVPSLRRVTGLETEERRRNFALTKPTLGMAPRTGEISSMSALWLIPQLTLAGIAEAFAAIGQMEFYYKQFPENMKSFAGSIFYVGAGVSSYLASFLISTVHRTTAHSPSGNWLAEDLNKAKLDYFYFMLTGLMVVNMAYFLLMARWYRYKGGNDEDITEIETNEEETKQQQLQDKNSV